MVADAPIAALINKWGFDLAGGIIEELTMLDRPIVRCFLSEERTFSCGDSQSLLAWTNFSFDLSTFSKLSI